MESYDYIIVGGGSAGCIVAARLAESGKNTVLLLEAGRTDAGDSKALNLSQLEEQDESYDWGYQAETIAGSGRHISYARAKLLGGCANHNDCAFIAPPPSDLNRWEQLGATGWGPEGTASALARIEHSTGIEDAPEGNALSRALIDAGVELGLPFRNFRQEVEAGTGWFPLNAKGDLRQSSSVTYLHPLLKRENIRVQTEAPVSRIAFQNRRAVGVETPLGQFRANHEVILTAGSINTPQLLMLSGVGPAAHLHKAGIETICDSPGIGRNLIDHVAANIACELHAPPPLWQRTPCESVLLLQVDHDAPAPDVLFHFVLRLREKYVGGNQFANVAHGIKISPNVARPRSRGWLELQSPDWRKPPKISLNYLSDADGYDQRILIAGLRYARKLSSTKALGPWLKSEVAPGPACMSNEEFIIYIKETCETVYHPCGTCAIGSVVTPDLKVKGIDALRIADASVFPDMVTVNINNTVMMVAEKAASLIRAKSS